MKKILASILASAMVFSLSACGSSAPAESSNAAPAASTAQAVHSGGRRQDRRFDADPKPPEVEPGRNQHEGGA